MSKHLMNTPCILLWLFFFLLAAAITPSTCSNNETDFRALLAFKKAIDSDPNGALNSWNETVPLCSWQGIFCSQRHQNRVTALDLTSRGLIGSLSPHLGNLSFLRNIILQNNSFYGRIPDDIGRLRRLRLIEFSNNSFSGDIPRNLSQCTNIHFLNLIDNNLTGYIIPELGSLRKLELLALGRNRLSGGIPPSIGNITSLLKLSLTFCGISGEIPDSFVKLQSLNFINLHGNNLTGTIPLGLFNISTIYTISVRDNRLQGTIPPDIGLTLPRLRFLDFGNNNFNGVVPFSLSNCSLAQMIQLDFNSLSGLPNIDFTRLSNLEHFIIENNQLVGDLSFVSSMRNCTKLKTISLESNSLSGYLPLSISNLSSQLNYLTLGENHLHGSIPTGIENLIGLRILSLQSNNLEGPIPFVMGKLNKVQMLYLGGNRLTNEIPFSFGNLTLLNGLYLDQNNLNGNIPPSLSNCDNLLLLDISGNNLSGSVPRELMSLSSISKSFNLSHNAFTGSIPSEVGSLTNLASLDLSHNRFSGLVPASLGNCVLLVQLYLESNSLYGEIPNELSTLRGLQYLDLSQNNLSGAIPRFLGEMDLAYLNLSFNRMEGEVPTSKVFQNGSAISLEGNNELCGGIPSLHFPPCPLKSSKKRHFHMVFIILIVVVAVGAICVVLSICFYVFVYKRRKSGDTQSSMPSLKGEHSRLSYADLLKSTHGFCEGNLLGKGGFGSVYKGVLDGGQTMVAVKVLNLNAKGASRSFVSECTILRGIRHRNLVKIESVCFSTDFQGNDFKALVYEYMVNGNLDEWLHGKSEDETRTLSLRQRLNIAIDIASALEYLHFGTNSVIVHGDLKPSNILLDEEMNGHVGDFGLAKVVSNMLTTLHESSSIGIKGTIGYIPPEYGMSGVVSTEGDVYSFGIVLLEMFTGRRPTENSSSLRDFVRSELPSGAMEIVDSNILDEHNHNTNTNIEKCIISVLEIGVACSEELPRNRMLMADVVSELNKIVLMVQR